ncbi:hypothetical protein CPC735_072630 [Coccidioides posadasii C735 delta SOWgp]|uniref:Peptidase S8/S53 domain-containing protein n=1 Tax=Coccidioides posadasii (strain C735) TaxID=222929 RepID=C5P1M3_COCP7|nr:hypothetical protein CPC735_072630 [Coccidioides posadasii C735 delta SOWgp]EER29581.1 hypothetical protein CPC735_072630 [Coccidioides posadasii C735 delta SOWgp]|eukprot:XP_003071726.1 hypothetical protein CPC735_072630 [Coccidioides posadasii C735 delta SOWgp]
MADEDLWFDTDLEIILSTMQAKAISDISQAFHSTSIQKHSGPGIILSALEIQFFNCPPLPSNTTGLDNMIVLAPFCLDTLDEIASRGAEYILAHFPDNMIIDSGLDSVSGFGIVNRTQGDDFKSKVLDGEKLQITFSRPQQIVQHYSETENTMSGGSMNSFSSWAPTLELDPAPFISAPGGSILSTIPTAQGAYGIMSGTSMATPYIAGVVALLMEARGKMDPKSVASLLGSTAQRLKLNDGNETMDDIIAPIIQQGGGLVDAAAAVRSQTTLEPSFLAFRDAASFEPKRTVKIRNEAVRPLMNRRSSSLQSGRSMEEVGPGYIYRLPRANASLEDADPPTFKVAMNFHADLLSGILVPETPISGFNGTIHPAFGPIPSGSLEFVFVPSALLADGKSIAEGKFTLKATALRWKGDLNNQRDWEEFSSPPFTIGLYD